jgi:hypothetical protein
MFDGFKTPIKVLKGINGDMELYNNRVSLRKTGWLSWLLSPFSGTTKTLRLHEITNVHYAPRAIFQNGFIKLTARDGANILFIYRHRAEPQALEMAEKIEDLASRTHVYAILHKQARSMG